MFRLATKQGIYNHLLGASDLQIQENVTAEQMRLNGVLEKYMAMRKEEWKNPQDSYAQPHC